MSGVRAAASRQPGGMAHGTGVGIDAHDLDDQALLGELEQLHRTRHETLRHGADDALEVHTRRTRELEDEYVRRNPGREVDPARTRDGV